MKSYGTKAKISGVKGLYIDDLVMYKGHIYRVTSFPTRNMVCGTLIHEIWARDRSKMHDPPPQSFKIPRREVDCEFNEIVKKHAKKIDWNKYRAGRRKIIINSMR